ncbi:MAG TPA: fimbrial protein [Steroidobacteraceae bacterium]|jgi:major type 1 subunit fimbrin (pilin)|nr:fimbrial protein [Steroidobacteraceae bacterium]
MDIRIKRAMMAAGIATAMALPLSSQASDGTITFTGAVTASSCALQVNNAGTGDGAVTLPTVDTSALTNAGATLKSAAGTFFSIALTNCTSATDLLPGPTATSHVAIYFEAGPNVDEATGGLINAGTSNVEVNLYNASNATVIGSQIKPGTSTNTTSYGTPLSLAAYAASAGPVQWFYAGYSTLANAGHAASAGSVSTSVTYSLVYN